MAQRNTQLVDRTSLPHAQKNLAKEESQLQAEINAFEDFLRRLNKDPLQPYRSDGGTQTKMLRSQTVSTSTPQKAVQVAYQETVLAVEHWEDAYGKETVIENIANEFGSDVAACLSSRSPTWSPLLWNKLRNASEEAIKTRQRTQQIVTTERQQLENLQNTLAEIGDQLARIERAEYSFSDRSDRLVVIQDRLEQLANEHQSFLRQRSTGNADLFSSFVYSDIDADYPGLAALATACEVHERIELRHWNGMI
jgi:hypothetical protein